tara:strand:+ start:3575 stop:4060 length:486 start_codon:yes stop_codon:yes gene_type:complete
MVKIINHLDLKQSVLEQIIEIKSFSWNYSYNEHSDWIKNNLKPDDIHFLIYNEDDLLICYLNLVSVCIKENNKKIPVYGIGNVCTRNKGTGEGRLLMNELNSFLLHEKLKGLLFCRGSLVPFYKKFNWYKVYIENSNNMINTMIFNFKDLSENLKYDDRNF